MPRRRLLQTRAERFIPSVLRREPAARSHWPTSLASATRALLLAAFVLLLPLAARAGEIRLWQDDSGQFRILAELVEVKDGNAVLKRDDGRTVSLPLNRLSAEDRAYLEKHGAGARAVVREAEGPQRWALLVGVNDYAELDDLKYCGRDMQALAENLKGAGFPEDQIFLLHNEAKDAKNLPVKLNIEKQLELVLSLANEDDLVLVAFSGHGMYAEGVTYLCPAEARAGDPKGSMVSLDFVYEKLEKCPATLKLLVADACRNDPRPQGRKTSEPKGDATQLAKQFERPPAGVLVLASCDAGQVSWEDQELEHGVFTHYLLKGLSGEADGNNNGRVSLGELFEYSNLATKKHVARRWSDYQTPQLFGRLSGVFEFERTAPPGPEPLVKNSLGMEFVLIPAGEFMMGTPESETERHDDEQQHRVRITKPFYLGKHEVTVGQFRRFVTEVGYTTEPEKDGEGGYGYNATEKKSEGRDPKYNWKDTGFAQTEEHPVVNITWNDATAFCQWLSRKEGKTYRLPTEAEWEYACRAGTSTKYHFGNDSEMLAQYGNVADASAKHTFSTGTTIAADDSYTFTAPVGRFKANPFGVHDMHGNLWEWCQDWYDKDYYAGSSTDDPGGPSSGEYRIVRGGSWNFNAWDNRAGNRFRLAPDDRHLYYGFRLARTP